jgi:hypothetical protein
VVRPQHDLARQAAETAGLTRTEFINALGRANVTAIQITPADLKAKTEMVLGAGSQCVVADPPFKLLSS